MGVVKIIRRHFIHYEINITTILTVIFINSDFYAINGTSNLHSKQITAVELIDPGVNLIFIHTVLILKINQPLSFSICTTV